MTGPVVPSESLDTMAPAIGKPVAASVITPVTVPASVSARSCPVIGVVPTTVTGRVASPNPGDEATME